MSWTDPNIPGLNPPWLFPGDSNAVTQSHSEQEPSAPAVIPSRASLFHLLPPELMRHIDSYLEPGAFINWAFSHWPLLQRNELAPTMTKAVFSSLNSRPSTSHLLRLPAEIRLEIMIRLDRQEQLNYVLADYQSFVATNLAPRLDMGTLVLLRRACR